MNALIFGIVAMIAAKEPPITAVAFSRDGQQVLAGSQAGVKVYHWPDLKQLRSIPTKLAHVHDIGFSPDGRKVAIVGGFPGQSGEVELLDWPDGTLVRLSQVARVSEAFARPITRALCLT